MHRVTRKGRAANLQMKLQPNNAFETDAVGAFALRARPSAALRGR